VGFPGVVLFVVVPLVVFLVVLEGRRQRKKYGKGSGTGANLSRAGLMELQSLLEPERKVEILREMERKEDLLVEVDDQAGPKTP
jgi:hypothetical protein